MAPGLLLAQVVPREGSEAHYDPLSLPPQLLPLPVDSGPAPLGTVLFIQHTNFSLPWELSICSSFCLELGWLLAKYQGLD
jgi:hypothetical protein